MINRFWQVTLCRLQTITDIKHKELFTDTLMPANPIFVIEPTFALVLLSNLFKSEFLIREGLRPRLSKERWR